MEMQQHPSAPGPAPRPPRRRSFVWPTLLILLGVIFLLNNFGLDLNLWPTLWHLWPVWLIAAGVDLIFRRETWGAWLSLGVLIASLGLGFWYYSAHQEALRPGDPVAIHEMVQGARQADVHIESGVGQLRIDAGTDPQVLVDGAATPLVGLRIAEQMHVSGDTAYFRLSQEGNHVWVPTFQSAATPWELHLNPALPTNLRIDAGVGRNELDLSHVHLTSFTLHSGVGESVITMPAQGQLHAKIEGGVGAITVRIPLGMAARIRTEQGVGAIHIDEAYPRAEHVATTPGYESAANRLDLEISGGVGAINVEQVTVP